MENNFIGKEEYSNACKEVLEILKVVDDEDISKIPSEEIIKLKENANMDYKFSYNPEKDIKEQEVSKLAKAIIANYFMEYIASPIQKQKIIDKQRQNIRILEEEKRKKYNPDDVFKAKNTYSDSNSANLPVKVEKVNVFTKVIRFIKKMFKL